MNDIRRSRYQGLYIQSKKCLSEDRVEDRFVAWSSEQPSNDAVFAPGEVYFDFAETEAGAVEKLKAELDRAERKGMEKIWNDIVSAMDIAITTIAHGVESVLVWLAHNRALNEGMLLLGVLYVMAMLIHAITYSWSIAFAVMLLALLGAIKRGGGTE